MSRRSSAERSEAGLVVPLALPMIKTLALKSSLGITSYKSIDAGSGASIFYLPGLANTFESHKGRLVDALCEKNNLSLTHFIYYGWGESSSAAVPQKGESHICEWLSQAVEVFDTTTGPQVLVGYSMGGYLMLALALLRPERIRAVIGIAAGFGTGLSTDIMKLYGRLALETLDGKNTFSFRVDSDGSLPILNELNINCPVRLGHSMADDVVSYKNAFHISNAARSNDVEIYLTKSGTHAFDSADEKVWLEHQMKKFGGREL